MGGGSEIRMNNILTIKDSTQTLCFQKLSNREKENELQNCERTRIFEIIYEKKLVKQEEIDCQIKIL